MKVSRIIEKAFQLDGVNKTELADMIASCLNEECSEEDSFKRIYNFVYGDTLCKELCEEWVEGMRGGGKSGAVWSVAESDEVAKKLGITFDNYTRYEFWTTLNMMFHDYATATGEGMSETVFWGKLAKAFLEDEDARDGKLKEYYFHIAED